MFKKFKNDKYFTIAVYAFLVIAASIALIWVLMHFKTFLSWTSGVITAMSSFIYGFIIAYICNSIYKKLHKHVFKFVDRSKPHPKVRKAFSITFAYVIFLSVISLLLLAIIPSIVTNIRSLILNAGDYIKELEEWLLSILGTLSKTIPAIKPNEIVDSIYSFFSADGTGVFSSILSYLLANIVNIGTALVNQIFYILVGFILSVYFLIYKDSIVAKCKRLFCAFFKEKNYKRIVSFARYSDRTFGRYMLGAIVDSALVGVVMFIVLTIFKFPFAPLIAVTCGVTNIIPFFGPFIGAIPSAILILISPTGGPIKVIIFAAIVLILQQVDGNLIAPHIHGASTGLTPIGVIAAVTFTSHVFGFIGMVIGVPFCAVISYYFSEHIKSKLKKKNMPTHSDYYRVTDIFEDENFTKARAALEAEAQVDKSETIVTAAITDEVLQEIKEQVVGKVMEDALDGINEEIEAKAKEGEV